ncbi:MAG: tRNA (cytidine(34)-2'-O)-methyltransferase [Candidatus Sericytochromatia bacterium]|nr:tRNA (cytidine(34)-2'-O)-methyltransferase [Candidatus Sericytochromatia bacterium]
MPAVVLYQPEIPGNTGNISRLCVGARTPLHLIEPLGFQLTDRHLKRAGLDYWGDLELYRHPDWASFLAAHPGRRIVAVSTKGAITHSDWTYAPDDMLLFGRETSGLPAEILAAHPTVTIPQWGPVRSLNLSNAVAIVVYEAYRQLGIPAA